MIHGIYWKETCFSHLNTVKWFNTNNKAFRNLFDTRQLHAFVMSRKVYRFLGNHELNLTAVLICVKNKTKIDNFIQLNSRQHYLTHTFRHIPGIVRMVLIKADLVSTPTSWCTRNEYVEKRRSIYTEWFHKELIQKL